MAIHGIRFGFLRGTRISLYKGSYMGLSGVSGLGFWGSRALVVPLGIKSERFLSCGEETRSSSRRGFAQILRV